MSLRKNLLKVVVVSFGSIAKRHTFNLISRFPDIRILVLRRSKHATQNATLPENVRFTDDIGEALEFSPDAVYICSPAPFHARDASRFCKQGADLFIEKPIGVDEAEVAAFLAQADEADRLVSIGYHLRYHPAVLGLNDLIHSGAYGDVLSARLSVGQDLRSWRPNAPYQDSVSAQASLGGGAVLELSHEIDLALFLFGSFASVTGHISKVSDLEIDVEDCADAILVKDDGRAVSVHMDFLQLEAARTIEVVMTRGLLRADIIASTVTAKKNDAQPQVIHAPENWVPNDVYLAQQDAFWADVQLRTQPKSNGWTALEALNISNAIKRSSETGERISV